MALYDSTTQDINSEFSAVYDNDGTADHQFSAVYDNDGTTDHLVYSAEQVLYQGGDQHAETGGSWTSDGYNYKAGSYNYTYAIYAPTFNADNIYLYQPAGLRVGIAGKNSAISLNGWSTLTFNIRVKNDALNSNNLQDGRWGGIYVATSKIDTAAVISNYFNGSISTSLVSKTVQLNVSQLTGSYYIFAAAGNGTALYIDSVILT